MKENLRSENEKQETMRLSSIKSDLSETQSKIVEHFMSSKKIIFFLCIYKMVDISAETWKKLKFL